MRRFVMALSLAVTALLPATGRVWAQSGENDVEEIFVARTVRHGRVVPSDFCAPTKTGFAPALEDQLTIHAVTVRQSDGRMTDTGEKSIGELRVCIGQAMDPTLLGTYTEGQLNGIAFNGVGDCRLVRGNQPEEGLLTHRCFLALSGLPEPYVGGFLISSSLYSRTPFGPESSPPGYAQAGIVIIRLWRKRLP
ncbi:MAG: hypothetical protein E6614_05660 [Bradyrhizobium sp.]|jgi:hypothetical protein|uniref:Uncharacterized protein n=2 Tax=Nitrobacteraceae TaxID=41294 RepID=A0ABS5G0M8_9BRAD|nr:MULTISPECIES: hypothetical protein [Bradyrhizobium]MBR1134839.1 hypothetical protein [Bradyrhizobium denitrificans]MDU1492288.1 hypothetical protein [Bradyrhizobium sp.]MDU1542219.1 hypothetical protein [Bradyrhizobium sp.]MDU1694760.1 hypothetical protein [Bradyrhizobium sp.]MDU1805532.1 hypothetical protein [Bradyrhizobium sp.]